MYSQLAEMVHIVESVDLYGSDIIISKIPVIKKHIKDINQTELFVMIQVQ